MLKGFKDFIMRGNVMELAIAVIIGSAFTAIVTAISDYLIQPIINSFGGTDVKGLVWEIRSGNETTEMDFGAIITAVINFLIIAAVVYFLLVAPMNKINEMNMRRKGIDTDETEATEAELLIEIRDLLAAQGGTPDTSNLADVAKDLPDDGPTSTGRHSAD